MMKWKNSPQKNLQEVTTANELIKNDLNNITESEFRIVIKSLGLKTVYRTAENLLPQRSRD